MSIVHLSRTLSGATGLDISPSDEIWTLSNERKFLRTSTTSTGLGSSLRDDNNRSLDCDLYSTDLEDSQSRDGPYRRYYPNTPTTSGLGSSSERSKELPEQFWGEGSARFGTGKSLQTITRQPRPNHDWVRTERIARYTKHRTISQSPRRELQLPELWPSKLAEPDEVGLSGFATQRPGGHRCRHQARRSFSTSIVADLAVTPDGSQQSLGSAEYQVSASFAVVLGAG